MNTGEFSAAAVVNLSAVYLDSFILAISWLLGWYFGAILFLECYESITTSTVKITLPYQLRTGAQDQHS